MKIENAIQKARRAIESQYDGVCDIIEYQKRKNQMTKITDFEEVVVKRGQRCRVCFENMYVNTETETTSNVVMKVKLFIAPELNIKSGSKIVVTQNSRTTAYKNSGEPAMYATHQEVMLEIFKGWA